MPGRLSGQEPARPDGEDHGDLEAERPIPMPAITRCESGIRGASRGADPAREVAMFAVFDEYILQQHFHELDELDHRLEHMGWFRKGSRTAAGASPVRHRVHSVIAALLRILGQPGLAGCHSRTKPRQELH